MKTIEQQKTIRIIHIAIILICTFFIITIMTIAKAKYVASLGHDDESIAVLLAILTPIASMLIGWAAGRGTSTIWRKPYEK